MQRILDQRRGGDCASAILQRAAALDDAFWRCDVHALPS